MAGNSVGSLTVKLGLDASEYTRGLTRAERSAEDFARKTRGAILAVGNVLGGLAIGAAVVQATRDIIAEAAALNDLSDATGSSVEALSQLSNQAKVAGTDFGTMQTALLKLSAGMAGTDEETTKAKDALKLLGISTRDPAQALQEIAAKFNTYADGVNKVGLAVALFGKQGGAFVATLKDIAELQDVGATVSARQAAEAENLEKAFRRLGVEAQGFKNIILSDVIPALNEIIKKMRETVTAAGGFWAALRFGAETTPFEKPADGVARLTGELERLAKVQAGPGFDPAGALGRGITKQVADAQRQLEVFKKLRETELALPSGTNAKNADRQAGKPEAPFIAADAKKTKAIKDQVSEAQRLVESLEKQLQATLDLNAVDTARAAIFELQQSAQSGLTASIEQTILDYARQIDTAKELKKVEEERKRFLEEDARARERAADAVFQSIEANRREVESIQQGNEQHKEQLILLRDGEAALFAYTQAKLAKAAAEKEDLAAMVAAVGGNDQVVQAIRDQAKALRERSAILGELNFADAMKKELEAIKAAQAEVFDIGANALADFVNGTVSARDALKAFLSDLQRFLTSQALQGLKNSLLGGNGQGGGTDIFSILSKIAISYFTGGAGGGFSGGGFGEHFAMGGVSRGGMALVGERGPEIVDLPSGARVTPNHSLGKMGSVTINQNINVMPGASTASARQIAGKLRDATIGAIRER